MKRCAHSGQVRMEPRRFRYLPALFLGVILAGFTTTANSIEPAENAVTIEQDLALPTMLPGEGPETPVCIDGEYGLLVAGCTGLAGPEGPPGPPGDPGVPGNEALAGLGCTEGQFVIGFDSSGDIVCAAAKTPPQ